MNGQIKLFAIIVIGAILFLIVEFLKIHFKHKQRMLEKEKIISNIREKYDLLFRLQDAAYSDYERMYQKAVLYEDLYSAQSLDEVLKQLKKTIEEFNEISEADQYYEELIGHMEILWNKLNAIRHKFREIDIKIQDLREIHHEKTETYKAEEKKIYIPFAKSKYFKGCKDEAELTKKYHQLVKIYHPDNGGNESEFVQMREDYKKCQEQLRRG